MKRIYSYIYALFFLFTLSCSNKEVLLPKIELEGIPEIHNHSSIWIFFEVKDNDTIALLNKNNKILNTHWIFNIDKRLPMVKIIPFLESMQENKNKDSMHKKGDMFNYFSYANTKDKSISLVIFNPTTYVYNKNGYKNDFSEDTSEKIIEVDLQNEVLFINNSKIENDQIIEKLEQIRSKDSLTHLKIIFKYTGNTTFQYYLSSKSYLLKTGLDLDMKEYVYSLK
jgi:hypothetical protein